MLDLALECIDHGLALLDRLAVVVVHDVKAALGVGLGLGGVAPDDRHAVLGQLAVLLERVLAGKLLLIAGVQDGHLVALGHQLLGQVQADERVAPSLGVGDQHRVIANGEDQAPAGAGACPPSLPISKMGFPCCWRFPGVPPRHLGLIISIRSDTIS